MRSRLPAVLLLALYLALVLAPLLALWLHPLPPRGGFWRDLAMMFGFAGLAMQAMQFLLTGRLPAFTATFGIDVIYYFHRLLAWVLGALVLGHVLLLSALDPALWSRLHPDRGDWRLQSGALALLWLWLLMGGSAWRRRLRLPYQHWRRLHLLLAVLALGFGYAHLFAVGYYGSPLPVRLLWLAMLGMVCAVVLHLHLLRPWRLYRRPWRLAAIRREQGDCWTLTLAPEGHEGMRFQPGQFAWLSLGHTPFSLQEHPFSLACAPQPDATVQFTVKALGDFTRTLERFPTGTRAWVDGPYGIFSYTRFPDAPGYVFFGGGIGIAPILGMLQALAAGNDRRPHLLFAAHSRFERIPRREEIVAMARRLDLRAVPVLEEPPEGWEGERGWMTQEMLARHLGPEHLGHHYFLCGPKPMTDAVERFLGKLGVPAANIHTELFAMA